MVLTLNNAKRPKCTYAARREEAKELREEICRLESQVAVLKIRSAEPGQEQSEVDAKLKQTQKENAKLRDKGRRQQLEVAKMQSAMGRCLMRDFCGVRFETMKFPGVKFLQQVYDAAVYYLTNMEISITERLGHVTVRDDYDSCHGSMYNARVLSTVYDDVTLETSSLLFPKMDAEGKYGMVVLDSVDEDELYPYNSATRVRKDISATAVFVARRKPATNGVEGELVVTMIRAAFLKIHRPQFPLSEETLHELSTGIMAWGDVMVKTIRSIVYGAC
ncbi:hypothetical protein PHYSODRAFT_263495 [Phytophthora sojae]|uniref:Uncharacterized protein n=1 Tax=Phytophthora sojae (strain P6497) TaxID=1094619 RepID=G4YQ20_PHYSP|nr:hypothetical protein PHYSODRAFT_263495 [Phytophthora sojae]EGZ29335.1 hypothetical protein PHYSODRAFT_263495 [Phytophthora sojae]|eukprot:XP_009516610.1 hypothetical protein PHYSODRAFT_263495 [Phytophthora sojae]